MPEMEEKDDVNIHEDIIRKPSSSASIMRRIIGIILILIAAVLVIFGITKLISVIKSKTKTEEIRQPLKSIKLEPFRYNLIDSETKVIAIVSFEISLGYSGLKNDPLEKEVVERKEKIKDAIFFMIKNFTPRDFYLTPYFGEHRFQNMIQKIKKENEKKKEKDTQTIKRLEEAFYLLTEKYQFYKKDKKHPYYILKQNITPEEEQKLLDIFELTGFERSYFIKEELREQILEVINTLVNHGKIDDVFFWQFNIMYN